MGKYMRKTKTTGEVAVLMDLTPSTTHGVRTRARALALQRLFQRQTTPPQESTSYLQLRSRRLEKNISAKSKEACKGSAESHNGSKTEGGDDADTRHEVVGPANSEAGSVTLPSTKRWGRSREEEDVVVLENEVSVEASFGDNAPEIEDRNRDARETTPCSMMLVPEATGTPDSTSRSWNLNAANRMIHSAGCSSIPSTEEMEEFFTSAEQLQQRMFLDKYNYDILNDCPVSGRYEWMRLASN